MIKSLFRILFSLLISSLRALFKPARWTFGKYLHVDRVAILQIKCTVVDATSGNPLSNAEVAFLDTGLDRDRSMEPGRTARILGLTDGSGQFVIDFEYTWGKLERRLGPPAGTFEIWIRHPTHKAYSASFDIQQLPRSNSSFEVDLRTVSLTV